MPYKEARALDGWYEWIYDVFDDSDVELFLFSNFSNEIPKDYQFENWFKDLFYSDRIGTQDL